VFLCCVILYIEDMPPTMRVLLSAYIILTSQCLFACFFVVVGCANPAPPVGGTISRDGDVLTVRCNVTGETWFLTCSRSRWIGSVGNCSAHASKSSLRVSCTSFFFLCCCILSWSWNERVRGYFTVTRYTNYLLTYL